MTDFVAALARKHCFHHAGRFPSEFCDCPQIAAAIREALKEAEKIAHEWPLSVDHCVAALKIGRETGDLANSLAFIGFEIAAAIRALREGR